MNTLELELIEALKALVKVVQMWPGEKNPEFFPAMKTAKELIARVSS